MTSPQRLLAWSSILLCLSVISCAETPDTLAPSLTKNAFDHDLASVYWQAQTRTLVTSASASPIASGRIYALVSVGQYAAVTDAIALVDDGMSPQNPNGFGAGGRDVEELLRGAVAGASAQVLGYLFPASKTAIDARVTEFGDATPGDLHPEFVRGVTVGRAAGQTMVDWGRADGFTRPATIVVPPPTPGVWFPAPGAAPAGLQLPGMTPYFLTSAAQFHAPPPPAFGTMAFMTALNEVSQISLTRTAFQLSEAHKWNYAAPSPTPPGFWNLTAAGYIEDAGLSELEATHVFALMHAAMSDAQIGCWETKFTEWVMRPSQAATALGLPAITLPTGLPNHASYPSGHSCLSAAAAVVLGEFFNSPDQLVELSTFVRDAGLSRIYGGIHYRFDVVEGNNLGRSVAAVALAYDRNNGLLDAVR
jgi:hypothetical protein